ncbi:hypothetical protein [Actinomycetospora soli]|uniref:hypothetical protein n=1 Tax=Actinomycetospora soli TaxID=2893887 RepID=UPI001E4484F8|nr:hypothetical protein [Actinomycetospora soli]MCD2191134.1 hypothetical protein [Actinomycetospora soli]
MPTPPSPRPDDGHLSARERAVFDDMTRRLGDVADGRTPTHATRTGSWTDRLVRSRRSLQVTVIAAAVILIPSSRWAAVAMVVAMMAVELVVLVRRRRRASNPSDRDS